MGKLDTNIDLIGFENGIFREGLPDDYVTLSTKQKYKEFNENDINVKWVEKFFSKVQTDKEMNEYIKTFFASSLDGRVSSEKFIYGQVVVQMVNQKVLNYPKTQQVNIVERLI